MTANTDDRNSEVEMKLSSIFHEPGGLQHAAGVPVIGTSAPMLALLAEVKAFAGSDHNVLIQGDTGVGKELIAQLLHEGHPRYGQGTFVPINCGAIPDGLFESLFFGHARGAFTGAIQAHQGYFEQASGGTLFMDEVGELPLFQQVKLLRVFESGVMTRVGSLTPIRVDFRLVAATNRNLREMVRAGTFRADLFYRLAVIELKVPNLEDRGVADKIAIFSALLVKVLDTHARAGSAASADVPQRAQLIPEWLIARVAAMRFPGNVRQLGNLAQRIGVIVRQTGGWDEGMICRALHLVEDLPPLEAREARDHHDPGERLRIIAELDRNHWQRQITAARLGMSRKSLWEKMRKLGIVAPDAHDRHPDAQDTEPE